MTGRLLVFGWSALLIAACGGEQGEDRAAEQPVSAAAAAGQETLPSDVQLAVTVARAIDAAPGSADSILSVHGLTVDSLEALMYAIAADSAKTAAYDAARR